MGISIQVEDHSKEVLDALDETIEKALEACGMQAEGYAKTELSNTPKRIDTGLLRNSITYAVSGKPAAIRSYHASSGSNRSKKTGKRISATSKNAGTVGVGRYGGQAPEESGDNKAVWIGTNVQYATYVHDGTMKMAANPFLRNAITKHADRYRAIIQQFLKSGE